MSPMADTPPDTDMRQAPRGFRGPFTGTGTPPTSTGSNGGLGDDGPLGLAELAQRLHVLEADNARLRNQIRNENRAPSVGQDLGESVFRESTTMHGQETRRRLLELRDQWERERLEQAARNAGVAPPQMGTQAQPMETEVLGEGVQQGPSPTPVTPMQRPSLMARIPSQKQTKLNLEKFTGKEVYRGLGCDFTSWGQRFLRQVQYAELGCGFPWPEEIKVEVLMRYLGDAPLTYVQQKVDEWWNEMPQLWHVLDHLDKTYKVKFSQAQVQKLFTSHKDPKKSWTDHYLFMLAASKACGGRPELVLENIALHAATEPELRTLIRTRHIPDHPNPLRHAEELVQYAQSVDLDASLRAKPIAVNALTNHGDGGERRKCFACGAVGHIRANCPNKNGSRGSETGGSGSRASGGADFVLAVAEVEDDDDELDLPPPTGTYWVLDTGSSRHLVGNCDRLLDFSDGPESGSQECVLPDGGKLTAKGEGTALLSLCAGTETRSVSISDVQYAPDVRLNIISYRKLEKRGVRLEYHGTQRWLVKNGNKICRVYAKGDVLVICEADASPLTAEDVVCAVAQAVDDAERTPVVQEGRLLHFHLRLGHLAYATIEKMARDPSMGIKLTDHNKPHCMTCAEGKQSRSTQPQQDSGKNAPTDRLGGVICSDLKGPITPRDRQGNRYLVNFVDYKSNYCRVFLSKTKDEAAKKFKDFLVWFEKRFDCRVHVLRTDGGGEYKNVDAFCRQQGVRRQESEPYNQASNGKAERMHRTVLNMARTMLFGSGMALKYWGDAVEYAVYVLNRVATRTNPGFKSPLEMLTGKKPLLTDLLVFGSECTVFTDPKKKALRKHAVKAKIIGKNDEMKGFKVYIPAQQKVITTRNVQNVETLSEEGNNQLRRMLEGGFDVRGEDPLDADAIRGPADSALVTRGRNANMPGETDDERRRNALEDLVARRGGREGVAAEEGTTAAGGDATQANDAASAESQDTSQVTTGVKQQRRRLRRGGKKKRTEAEPTDRVTRLQSGAIERRRVHFADQSLEDSVNAVIEADPKNYNEAMRSNHRDEWFDAVVTELDALQRNGTWSLVEMPSQGHPLHSKWVFKTKMAADGSVERRKARLVVCGNEQREGLDYDRTFAPVVDMTTVKFVLAMARKWNVPARHGDVPNAYVRADSEEGFEIHMRLPQGMPTPKGCNYEKPVLLLKKSLYGLKQSGRQWNLKLQEVLQQNGYTQCKSDKCLYWKLKDDSLVLVAVYVDDLLVTAMKSKLVDDFFEEMAVLEIKNLGPASKFLGVRIEQGVEKGETTMDQELEIENLLVVNQMQDANSVLIPIDVDWQEDPVPVELGATDRQRFQSLVGSLLWLSRCTRPDISFAVHAATCRTHAPTVQDAQRAKKILRYLKKTKDMKLRYSDMNQGGSKWKIDVCAYSDADYAADQKDRKSVSGVVVMVDGMVVDWMSKKQTGVALSTMESEYVAASKAAQVLMGMRETALEVGLQVSLPCSIYIDNQAALSNIGNEASSGHAKHISVRLKHVQDLVEKGVVKPRWTASNTNVADVMTKATNGQVLHAMRLFMHQY